jgi:hypothetical protein
LLVLRLSERFEEAAKAEGLTTRGVGPAKLLSSVSVELPFALHADARVVTDYQMVWPTDVSGPDLKAAASPIRIRHVRIEELNRFKRVLGYYKRLLPDAEEHLSRQGAWLDSLKDRGSAGTKISTDVLIVRDEIHGTIDKEEEKLRTDVLLIEIRDPSQLR